MSFLAVEIILHLVAAAGFGCLLGYGVRGLRREPPPPPERLAPDLLREIEALRAERIDLIVELRETREALVRARRHADERLGRDRADPVPETIRD